MFFVNVVREENSLTVPINTKAKRYKNFENFKELLNWIKNYNSKKNRNKDTS